MTTDFSKNTERVRPFYLIKAKIGKDSRMFLSNSPIDAGSSCVRISGVELAFDMIVENYETATKLMQGDLIEKFIPWSSVIEIDTKRFLKESPLPMKQETNK